MSARDDDIVIGWGAGVEARPLPHQITRREWFIAHAPDVPPWFRNKSGTPPWNPEELDPVAELTHEQRKEMHAWIDGSATEFTGLTPPVQEFMVRWQKVQDARKKFHEWHMERREAKWWAWREYWADKMTEGDKK